MHNEDEIPEYLLQDMFHHEWITRSEFSELTKKQQKKEWGLFMQESFKMRDLRKKYDGLKKWLWTRVIILGGLVFYMGWHGLLDKETRFILFFSIFMWYESYKQDTETEVKGYSKTGIKMWLRITFGILAFISSIWLMNEIGFSIILLVIIFGYEITCYKPRRKKLRREYTLAKDIYFDIKVRDMKLLRANPSKYEQILLGM